MRLLLPVLSCSMAIAMNAQALAQPVSLDPEYEACVAAVEANPREGRLQALRWISDGGGGPAIHCAAVGDLAMDLPRTAAVRLQDLAQSLRSSDPYLAARLYGQAAEAWTTAGRHEEAIAAMDDAYSMAPGALDLHLIAAPVYAAAKRWGLTKRALERAELETDLSAVALVLRARAHKELSDYQSAADDITRALRLDPGNVEGLILRGELVQAGYEITP